MDTIFHDVMAEDALADGEARSVSVGARSILIARIQGRHHAIGNRCSHAASQLDGGKLRGTVITCPLHGARFDVTTGKCTAGPYAAIPAFEVIARDGRILVALPDGASSG